MQTLSAQLTPTINRLAAEWAKSMSKIDLRPLLPGARALARDGSNFSHRFLTPWTEGKTPGAMPTELSRHVTVHAGAPQHFDDANGLVAVLLAASVLRAFQELDEIRSAPDWATRRVRRANPGDHRRHRPAARTPPQTADRLPGSSDDDPFLRLAAGRLLGHPRHTATAYRRDLAAWAS